MNWELVKEKYPKSHHAVAEWLHVVDSVVHFRISKLFQNERSLYDFFDRQKLYISILKEPSGGFSTDISVPGGNVVWENTQDSKNRDVAEESAFMKTFELLEEKLNN